MKKQWSEKGSALVYILIAIGLLAILTATFMGSSSQQSTTASTTYSVYSALKSQADYIRSAIQECVLSYPKGDLALGNTKNMPYPLAPDDPYLESPMAPFLREARFIRCPGNPGNSNNHARIFDSSKGKMLPPHPPQFGPWVYENTADGVFILIGTEYEDPYILAALHRLDESFSKCEADIIDSRTTGWSIVSTGDSWCPLGHTCFRVRITTLPTAQYPTEAGCP